MRVVRMNPSSAPKREIRHSPPVDIPAPRSGKKPRFDIKSFKADDWILLGIIAILIFEESDDYMLLCALGYLFLAGL